MVIWNPIGMNIKDLILFCFGNDLLIKSIWVTLVTVYADVSQARFEKKVGGLSMIFVIEDEH